MHLALARVGVGVGEAGGVPPFELLERSGVSFDPALRAPIAPGFSNQTRSPGLSSIEPISEKACCAPPQMKICPASQVMPRLVRRCEAIAWRNCG